MTGMSGKLATVYATAWILTVTLLITFPVNNFAQRKPGPQLPNPDLSVRSTQPFRLVGSRSAALCIGRQNIGVRIDNAAGHSGTNQVFTVRLNLHQHPDRFDQTVDGIGAGLGPASSSKLVIFNDVNITAAGDLPMIVTVDIGGQVNETNEDNNRKSFKVAVAGTCPPFSSQ